MKALPLKLVKKLNDRRRENSFRSLPRKYPLIDFSSNDYLGFSQDADLFSKTLDLIATYPSPRNGSGGSRLLTGSFPLYELGEEQIRKFNQSESALIFNSGYTANLGLLASLPQRGDLVLYDELVHASVRDGISLSRADSLKYRHNDLDHLRDRLKKAQGLKSDLYIVTESVFSMDGDMADLKGLVSLAEQFGAHILLDEAHSYGLMGPGGRGRAAECGVEQEILARVVTFSKAFGTHGGAVIGGTELKDFLVNFSRSFIYTTALPPHDIASLISAHAIYSEKGTVKLSALQENINSYLRYLRELGLTEAFSTHPGPIQTCLIPGNEQVRAVAQHLEKEGYEVKPILSPTVPEGKERLRFCLHSFNTSQEILEVLSLVNKIIK